MKYKMHKTKFKQTEIGMIPEEWEVKRLGDLGYIKTGKGTKKLDFGKCEIIGSNGFLGYTNNEEFLEEGPLIFTGRVGTIGQVNYLSKKKVWLSDNTLYFKTNNLSLLNFIYYSLKTVDFSFLNVGSTQPLIKQSDFKKLLIAIPKNPTEQRAIAAILSDLDSKIELNQQMNKTLEAIGQTIFKHWFVDFEFPNEEGKPYKSSGGEMVYNEELGKEIPKGWEVSNIGEKFETILGGTPSTTNKSYWENGNIAWINSEKINEFRITEPTAFITEEALNNSATKLMPKGTTVLAITGATLGQVSRIEIDTCANQSVIGIIESKNIRSEYIYFWIKHIITDIIRYQTGGAQQHINKNNVNSSKIIIPSQIILQQYQKLMKPIFDKISLSCFETRNLSQIRDTLLPKLMSGKIRVPLEGKE